MSDNNLITVENGILVRCNNKLLLTVDIPSGTEMIADEVFKDCPNLYQVTLPDTLKKIGSSAFENCSSLKEIDLTNVTAIDTKGFSGCKSLKKVLLGIQIGYLCNGVFCGCSSLESISLPNNISYIGCECFKDCTALSNIEMPGVMEIDNNAFEHCTGFYNLSLPKSLIHIGPNAFSFCNNIETVTVNNRFVDIDETAFENTVNLIFKAVQYSTAYKYAEEQKLKFAPAINEEKHRLISSSQVAELSKAGIMFQMKILNSDKAVIRYDKGQTVYIEQIIGREEPKLPEKEE